MESLPCATIVYRAMARKNWIDKVRQHVTPAAFVRRPPPKDDDGLSVDVDSARSCSLTLRVCFGVASLHVGHVREMGLDVVIDDPPHANIVGLPRPEDDRSNAERLASVLARHARLVPPNTYLEST